MKLRLADPVLGELDAACPRRPDVQSVVGNPGLSGDSRGEVGHDSFSKRVSGILRGGCSRPKRRSQ